MNMNIQQYKHPVRFYLLSTIVPWIFWFTAAYFSRLPTDKELSGVLLLIGLLSPMMIAFLMMYVDPKLRRDLLNRLFTFKKVRPIYLFLTLFLMVGSILLAQVLSLLVGGSIEQFSLSGKASFAYSLFPAWILLFLAPAVEELAWHSYGTDTLRARFSLFWTSIIFAIFWAIWHLPLSFIKGYYHNNLVEMGWIYALNFACSLIPFVILMNWLYYKTHRNIWVAVVFHITAGAFNEFFATQPESKVIQTALLLAFIVILLYSDPKFFFSKKYVEK